MSKTIEEAAREFADKEYEVGEIDWEALYKGYYWGRKDTLSLPLSQRLTDEERERVRKVYAECELIEMDDSPNLAADRITEAGAKMEVLERIFGKELFGKEN